MKRRSFFGAMLAGAAAFVVAPQARAEVAPPSVLEDGIRALIAGCAEQGHELTREDGDIWAGDVNALTLRHLPYPTQTMPDGSNYTEREEILVLAKPATGAERLAQATGWLMGLHMLSAAIPNVADARAEGYERGRAVEAARAVSRAQTSYWDGDRPYIAYEVPLTFEAMQADCEALGCRLDRHEWVVDTRVVYGHTGPGGPAYQADRSDPSHLARVDTWRRGLHE